MKAKDVFTWLSIFIIGSLIVTFLVSPNSFQSFKSNIKNIVPASSDTKESIMGTNSYPSTRADENDLISRCKVSLNKCKDISTRKYDLSMSIIEVKKFNDEVRAVEFYNTWNVFLGFNLDTIFALSHSTIEEQLPFVLIAVSLVREGEKYPVVAICDGNGELNINSKISLLC